MARKLRIIKTRRRVVLLIISFLLMIVVTILITYFGQPNKAVIVKSSQQDNGKLELNKGVTTLKGMYFTMEYQASLNSVTDITSQDVNAIEAFRIARSSVEDRRIMIVTIKHLPQGGIEEESAYKFRSIQPATYKATTETFNAMTIKMMSRSDNSEVVAFIAYKDKLAVIAYTAGASDTVYQDALEAIKTFVWL
jgi:hypothetical protein